jgi:ATP-binding cassette subfamily B protein
MTGLTELMRTISRPRRTARTGSALVTVLALTWRGYPAGAIQVLVSAVVVGVIPGLQIKITSGLASALLRAAGTKGSLGGILTYLLFMAGASLVLQVLSALQNRAMQRCQSRLSALLSGHIIRRATQLTLAQAEDPAVHDSLQRAVREVNFRPGLMFGQAVQLATQLATFGSVGAVLWSINFRVAILALLAPVPSLVAQLVQGRRGHELEHSRSQARRRLAYWQHVASQPDSIKEVLAFRLGRRVLAEHDSLMNRIVSADLQLSNRNLRLSMPLMFATAGLTFAAQAAAVLTSADTGHLAALFAVILAIGMLQSGTQQLFSAVAGIYVNQLYLQNVEEFLRIRTQEPIAGTEAFPARLSTGIEFRDVSFTYPGSSRPALRDLSITFRPNETTAIVGLNGAGKSTLGKLIGRLYEPASGVILADGRPLGEYDLGSLRDRISFVFQDYVEYQLTVGENISLGASSDEPEVPGAAPGTSGLPAWNSTVAAAQDVGMADYISGLPQGYQTQAGRLFDGGVNFSTGQWQRLAIARGLVRSASVRLMDEPTAAIDAIAEAALLDVLTEAAPGRVTVLIAHRFSSVLRADRIVVLDQGRVVEDGSHKDLMSQDGLYARMFLAQETSRDPARV